MQKMPKLSAKELTEEINRETDLAVAAGAEGQGFAMARPQAGQASTVPYTQAEQVGWKVLAGDQAQVMPSEGNNGDYGTNNSLEPTQNLEDKAKQEILRDEDELEHPTDYVGDESALQTEERLADATENLRNEDNPKRDFEAKIATSSQEKIARSAIAEVDKIINHKRFLPAELQQAYREIGNVMLNSFEVPHPIGKGNG